MKKLNIFLSFLFFLIALNTVVYAQEQFKHEKRFYRAPDGKLYVNKAKPIYFFISDSPNPSAEHHLLSPEESTKKYANPMYFDTEGWNTLRSPSCVDTVTRKVVQPEQDVKFVVFSDSKAPHTKLTLNHAPTYKANDVLFVGKGLSVSLSSTDETAGVEKVFFSSNGAQFSEYSKPIDVTSENDYVFKFYAADNVGNAEETKEEKITLDITAPLTQFRIEGDQFQDVLSARTVIHLTASDLKSGVDKIYYAFDDNQPRVLVNYISLSSLSEGNHTLKFYSIDNVKNQEEVKTYSFFLDQSAPIVIDEVLGNQFVSNGKAYSSGRTKFKLTAVDNKAGVKSIHYSIDGAEYVIYDAPFYLPTKTGATDIKYYATDNVNNKISTSKGSSKSTATYVDLTGPNLSHSYSTPQFTTRDTTFINSSTKITLKAVDAEAGVDKITYTVDKKVETDFTAPFSVAEEGQHSINFTGYDYVENTNSENFFFIVDNTPPSLYPRFSITPIGKKAYGDKNMEVFSPHVQLYLSATDTQVGVSKIFYSINGGAERAYVGPIGDFSKGKEYVVKVKIIDYLGNQKDEIVNFATGN